MPLLASACTTSAPATDAGPELPDAFSMDAPTYYDTAWWDATFADDVGDFTPPSSCDLGDPTASFGTYPDDFAHWPDAPVYAATIVAVRASRVSNVPAGLDHALVAHFDSLVYVPGADPTTSMPDAGPPGDQGYVGTDVTVVLTDLGTLADGDAIYIGNVTYESRIEAPNLLVEAEAVRVADHPSLRADLVRVRDYESDVLLYERVRHAVTLALVDIDATSGPFDCQFLQAYDYRSAARIERLLCGAMPDTALGIHTSRSSLQPGTQRIFSLEAEMPSACSFPPDAGFGGWSQRMVDTFGADELPRLVRLLTARPSLSL